MVYAIFIIVVIVGIASYEAYEDKKRAEATAELFILMCRTQAKINKQVMEENLTFSSFFAVSTYLLIGSKSKRGGIL